MLEAYKNSPKQTMIYAWAEIKQFLFRNAKPHQFINADKA